jgi:hypothetical protein
MEKYSEEWMKNNIKGNKEEKMKLARLHFEKKLFAKKNNGRTNRRSEIRRKKKIWYADGYCTRKKF